MWGKRLPSLFNLDGLLHHPLTGSVGQRTRFPFIIGKRIHSLFSLYQISSAAASHFWCVNETPVSGHSQLCIGGQLDDSNESGCEMGDFIREFLEAMANSKFKWEGPM